MARSVCPDVDCRLFMGGESNQQETALMECAHVIIDVVPRLSRLMRKDLRIHSAGTFTEPQFRVMAHLFREGERCLSDLADFLGVSLPTMSKLVQGLENRGLVGRAQNSEDRRRIVLTLTEPGRQEYDAMLTRTASHMVDWIGSTSEAQRDEIMHSLRLLDELFSQVELPATVEDES